jgi:hypothetical protein
MLAARNELQRSTHSRMGFSFSTNVVKHQALSISVKGQNAGVVDYDDMTIVSARRRVRAVRANH